MLKVDKLSTHFNDEARPIGEASYQSIKQMRDEEGRRRDQGPAPGSLLLEGPASGMIFWVRPLELKKIICAHWLQILDAPSPPKKNKPAQRIDPTRP